MSNFVRLGCWASFWISFYIFIDSLRVSGSRLNYHIEVQNHTIPNTEEYGNPGFPILVSTIFCLVSPKLLLVS